MVLRGGLVFQEDGTFIQQDLFIRGGRISEPFPIGEDPEPELVDAEGLLILPGLVDIHSHGAAGYDFSDGGADGLRRILAYEKAHGVTSYCPTSMTLSEDALLNVLSAARELRDEPLGAVLAGINMEGPFLDPQKKGAQDAAWIRTPDADFFRRCQKASGGQIRLITIAPNVSAAFSFIREVAEEVTVSLGHTLTDYETARRAMDAGAHHVTHLFNAMAPFAHREPGLVGAAFDDPDCYAELICDGFHIHPAVVRAAFAMMGSRRIVLISDSMMATGMPDGQYTLGGQEVFLKEGRATLADGTLAGSSTNLYDCMRKAIAIGIPRSDAIFAATRNPAMSIGIYDQVGSIAPGKRAHLLLTDPALNLVRVIMP